MSGVGVHTIRAWEKRYQAVCPARTQSGRREYNEKDLEKLVLLNQVCTLGHSIGKVANLKIDELQELLDSLGKVSSHESPEMDSADYNLEASLQNMLLALSAYKLEIVDHELNKIKLMTNIREIVIKVLIPLLQKIGGMIARRELSLSQEITFNSLLKFHLGEIIFKSRKRNQNLKKVVISTTEGCFDEIPLLMATLLLISKNFDVIYLGTNVPAGALLETIQATGATRSFTYLGPTQSGQGEDYYKKYYDFLSKKNKSNIQYYALQSPKFDLSAKLHFVKLYKNLRELDQKIDS